MSFIRAKEIPPGSGNWYDYEVMTIHSGGKVIQKHIRYIGKHGTGDRTLVGGSYSSSDFDLGGSPTPRPVAPKLACKFCGSERTRKFGFSKGIQTYFCNDCHTKFTGTDALAHGRVSPQFIANALHEYYGGMSFHEIEANLENQTDEDISHTAVIKWVNKYTNEAIRQTRDLHPPTLGDTWIADETYIKTDIKTSDPKGVVFWDIIDARTRFLLATRITTTRNKQDARALMEMAAKRAGKSPKVVVTDKLASYLDGIEMAFGSDSRHRQGGPFKVLGSGESTSLIERFHNSLKDRTKVMRDLRDKGTLKRFTDGWLVHYNFYRLHTALKGKAPAEAAGLEYETHNWADLVGYKKAPLVRELKPEVPTESA